MGPLVALGSAELAAVVGLQVVVIAWGTRAVSGRILARAPWLPLAYPLMLPGTVLHELAHAVVALLLGLGVTEIEVFRPHRLANGSVRFGRVATRRSAPVRDALVAVAPLLIVPPALLGITLLMVATWPHGYPEQVVVMWVVVVGLGSLGAFPSPGDHIPIRGAVVAAAILALALACGYSLWGAGWLAWLLALVVVGLSIPSVALGSLIGLSMAWAWARSG
jgi:hypothetical protein